MTKPANRRWSNRDVNLRVTEGDAPHRFSLSAFIKTALAVMAVAYVAVYLASRTSGFRSYLAGYLEDRLGFPVRIGAAHATWQLDLVLEQVASAESDQVGEPSFSVDTAVFRWSPVRFGKARPGTARRALELRHCRLSFAPGESGGWEPSVFGKVREWLEKWGGFVVPGFGEQVRQERADAPAQASIAKPAARLKPNVWERINLTVNDGHVVWWGTDGEKIASADGIELHVTPVWLPGRRMIHYLLKADEVQPAPGRRVRHFTLELLKAGSNEIVLTCTGDWGGGEPAVPSADGVQADEATERIRRELKAAAEAAE